MSELERVSISIERPLFERLERLVRDSRYSNRSEFIRDLIRERLVEQQWSDDAELVIGTITLVYNHHARQLADKLTDIQHDHHDAVLATTHVHLTHDLCGEMIMVRGNVTQVRGLADQLRQQKGVLHAALSMSTTGESV